MADNQHVRVHSRCGACGFRFDPGDAFFAFVCQGTVDCWSATFAVHGAFAFPNSGYCDNDDDHLLFCRKPDCRQCHSSPNSGTVHAHCLKLFLRQPDFKKEARPKEIMDGLRRLWLAVTWMSPWHGAVPPNVEPYVGHGSDRDLRGILDHLPQMASLAPELISMIWDFCPSSPLSRYRAVLGLYDELSVSKQHKRPFIPLLEIKSWARGCRPEYNNTQTDGAIRLTIDSRGLRRIERLKERPSRCSSRSDFKVFVVEAAECFSGVLVEFELNLARLHLPGGGPTSFHTWDTPRPPLLQDCCDPSDPPPPCHLGTVQLRGCTGLTFFMSCGSTYAIHAHTNNHPSAQSTFEALATGRQRNISWVYVPIEGQITKFGFSRLPRRAGDVTRFQSLLLGTETSGDLLIGPHETSFLVIRQPWMLIHDKPDSLPISIVGAYSENEDYRLQNINISPQSLPVVIDPTSSSASLERVSRVQIFYIPETAICRGIIIQYEHGPRSALGQCRVGIDPVQDCAMPSHLCFINNTNKQPHIDKELRGVQVVGTTIWQDHNHIGTSWTCCEMSGDLKFCVENEATRLEHVISEQ